MKDDRIILNETAIKNRSRKAVSETNITLSDWISNELFIALGKCRCFSWSCASMKMWTRLLTYMTEAPIFLEYYFHAVDFIINIHGFISCSLLQVF